MVTQYSEILSKIQTIDPIYYGKSRNFTFGGVSKISPYISRGVISTRDVMLSLLNRGYSDKQCERLFQQLAWRDYFQRVAQEVSSLEFKSVKYNQTDVISTDLSSSILNADSGIKTIDEAILSLYSDGWIHNHVRMYVASIVCNVAKTAWQIPAKWMYFHLLDADYASNFLSWQWVCGSFSSKKYYANQENINKYSGSQCTGTFLDVDYDDFNHFSVPQKLLERTKVHFKTELPELQNIHIQSNKPVLLYNYYNLDPNWHFSNDANRILLLEPSHFERFPISSNNLSFAFELAKNIPQLQIFVGEFADLKNKCESDNKIIFKEHPLFHHYEGKKEDRDWMFPEVNGYYPSFFKYWQACIKSNKHIQKLHS